jgi:hypothetical protein
MQPGSHLCLTVEFDLGADPVSGVVRSGAGDGDPFCGWMALTRTIELALASARSHQQDHPRPTREI